MDLPYGISVGEGRENWTKAQHREWYVRYHGTPKVRKHRAMRQRARRAMGLKPGDPREIDHIKPLSKGGSNGKKNLRIVSRHTNRSKNNKTEGRGDQHPMLQEASFTPKDIPKFFHVVFDLGSSKDRGNARAWKALAMGKFQGITGISGSAIIEPLMMDFKGNAILTMPGKETVRLNKLTRILYDNPDYLLSKGAWALKRVLDRRDVFDVIYRMLDKIELHLKQRSQDTGDRKFWTMAHELGAGGGYDLAKIVGKDYRIDGLKSLVRAMKLGAKQALVKAGWKRNPAAQVMLGIPDRDLTDLLKKAVVAMGEEYGSEAEWVVKGGDFTIPKGSKLKVMVKGDDTNVPTWLWDRYVDAYGLGGDVPTMIDMQRWHDETAPTGYKYGYNTGDVLAERGYILERLESLGVGKKYDVDFMSRKDFVAERQRWQMDYKNPQRTWSPSSIVNKKTWRAGALMGENKNLPKGILLNEDAPRVAYHVAFAKHMDSINARGLVPERGGQTYSWGGYGQTSRGKVFLTSWKGVGFWVSKYGDIADHSSDVAISDGFVPVVYKAKTTGIKLEKDEAGTRDAYHPAYYTEDSIAPRNLEVWNGSRWVKSGWFDAEDAADFAMSKAEVEEQGDDEWDEPIIWPDHEALMPKKP